MFVMRCFNPFNFSSLVSPHKQAGRGGKGEKQKNRKKRKGPSFWGACFAFVLLKIVVQDTVWLKAWVSLQTLSALTLYELNLKQWIDLLLVLSIEDRLGSIDTICVPTATLPIKEIYLKIVGSSVTQTTWNTRKLTSIHYQNITQDPPLQTHLS